MHAARNLVVGVDLDRDRPQICCYEEETKNTVTAPMKIGNEEVSFRDILDALDELEYEEEAAEEVLEEKRQKLEKDAAGIFRQALVTLGLSDPAGQITGITVTVPHLNRGLVRLIRAIYRELGIDPAHGFLQDYKESFYYHTLYQKKELWNRNVGFFRFADREVSFLSLSLNYQTRPITVTVTDGITITLHGEKEEWDDQFSNMINASLRSNIYSSIFLQGETFDRSWSGKSVALLCKGGRKVFIADNIFARGACYGSRERTGEKRLGGYLYLGDDMVRNNIGMKMLVQGKETYYPLISAGVNWYEAEKTCECILEGSPELDFLVSPMEDSRQTVTKMPLPGLDDVKRPEGTVRLRLHLAYDSPKRCVIEAEDLGFGDLYPSTGHVWREALEG